MSGRCEVAVTIGNYQEPAWFRVFDGDIVISIGNRVLYRVVERREWGSLDLRACFNNIEINGSAVPDSDWRRNCELWLLNAAWRKVRSAKVEVILE